MDTVQIGVRRMHPRRQTRHIPKAGTLHAQVPVHGCVLLRDFVSSSRCTGGHTWQTPFAAAILSFSPDGTIVATDPNGIADLNQIQLLLNSTPTRLNGCNVNYHVAENTFYLYNDGSAFLGGVTSGSASQISNGRCSLSGSEVSVRASGNNLTLNVPLKFTPLFVGLQNVYACVQGNDGLSNGGFV